MLNKYISRIICFFPFLAMLFVLNACDSDSNHDKSESLSLVEASVTVGDEQRTFSLYLPSNYDDLYESDARQIPLVFSFHDDGETGQISADNTRWQEIAEENGFVVVFPNAIDGSWNTSRSADGADEVAFTLAIWEYIRSEYTLSSGNPVYLTGIGTGGSVAQQVAMIGSNLSTIQVISAVASIRGTADDAVFNLPTGSEPAGASLPYTSMAVWMMTDNDSLSTAETKQAQYWKGENLNNIAATATGTDISDENFTTTSYQNVDNSLSEVRISTFKSPELTGKELSRTIWNDMFSKVLRFLDDTRVNGSLHPWESIAEMGLIEESKKFSEAAGGTHRWLTYLPSNYGALTANGGKLPLVLSLHGRKGSARWQGMLTQWHVTAEKHGFIAVYPQGTNATWQFDFATELVGPNPDVEYILELLQELESKYAIDTSRVILNGTSMGAYFTNRIAVEYPELFAGIAPCYSGHLLPDMYENYTNYPTIRTDVPIPVWQCRGGDEPDNAYPFGIDSQEAARKFWRVVINGYPEAPDGVEDNATPTETQIDGRKTTKIFNDGSGLAEYRWQVTDYVPHFWPPKDQAEKMWTEMFSKYQRVGTQIIKVQ
ncbi:alpha/beta hydrolase family esterase [Pelobacter seleniigenes]|uniref:alpha/beta hydrolase family esterase n=1 Tax=Pelobacter seleniigenes TaxID=407188 RepID=UPI0004A6AB04|nr:PHB depolymerase family esterase [Pelobacter seleniigenes]